MSLKNHRKTIAMAAAILCQSMMALATEKQAHTETTLETVSVVGTTPLPSLGVPKNQIPAAVQTAIADDLENSLDLSDYLKHEVGSIHVNETQGNPYQMDVNYRGYTASPLLGTPQGLSVYMDGVRLNQPFGDVVSWDLIPRAAIASMSLMPGSNPLFGLNTLGGSLSVQTKDGRKNVGTSIKTSAGSYGRWNTEFEHGNHNEQGLHWFVTGNAGGEAGWREASPSQISQLFSKIGWGDAQTDVALTVALANNHLTGNGLQEQRLWASDYNSIYTKPDETHNQSIFLNLAGQHSLNDSVMFSGNTYYRKIKARTLNGDLNDDALDQSVYQPSAAERAALTTAGYTGFPTSGANAANTPYPSWRCIANVLLGDEPAEKCNGLLNRTSSDQENYGLSGQFTFLSDWAGKENQMKLGAGYDASRSKFKQTSQFGYLNPDRSITPVNFFADGTELDDSGNPIDNRVDLTGRSHTWSIYATDTLSFNDAWHLTVSGRYNQTTLRNRDQITPGGGSGSLDTDQTFQRFNPAIGLAFTPNPSLNAYAGYNEGSRTPTTLELGCADPANPCKLPNAMAGDPPLKQVVTKTWEAGLRGHFGPKTHWNAGVFRADNHDDILFVADDAAGFGYFKNFGQTRRQGFELGWDTQVDQLTFAVNYTYLDATYRSPETVGGAANSSNDADHPGLDGNIQIKPGDQIPLMPKHMLKAKANWRIDSAWSLGVGMTVIAGSYARGNENNQHEADGTYYLGSGRSAGYAVFDLTGKYRATPQLSFFGQINNLFDRHYATASQLAATGFNADGGFVARPFPAINGEYPLISSTFYAPGAPRTLVVGLRYQLDK